MVNGSMSCIMFEISTITYYNKHSDQQRLYDRTIENQDELIDFKQVRFFYFLVIIMTTLYNKIYPKFLLK